MVCLVDDDDVKIILRELIEALLPLESLDRSDSYLEPAAEAGIIGLLYGAAQSCGLLDLVCRLLQEFSPVCHDQHSVSFADHILGNLCKHDGLTGAGGKDQECSPGPRLPSILDFTSCFFLIWP